MLQSEKNQKRDLFKKVHVFCEEKVLIYLKWYSEMLNLENNVDRL